VTPDCQTPSSPPSAKKKVARVFFWATWILWLFSVTGLCLYSALPHRTRQSPNADDILTMCSCCSISGIFAGLVGEILARFTSGIGMIAIVMHLVNLILVPSVQCA
jgi:hypothetical protein